MSVYDIGQHRTGHWPLARVEDPRGSEGNWLTTLSPLVLEETLNQLRDNPVPFNLGGGTVLPRAFLDLAASNLERPADELENVGALVQFVVELDDNGDLVPMEGVVASLESRRDYQIIYANGFGLPDPSLTETSATGIVWFFPLASEPDYHVLLPTYTSADGRVAVGQGFINHSAMSVIPYVFSVEPTVEVGD